MNDLLIVGTGALATLFAARLSQAGHSVTMLGSWKAGLAVLRKDGVRLIDAGAANTSFQSRQSTTRVSTPDSNRLWSWSRRGRQTILQNSSGNASRKMGL